MEFKRHITSEFPLLDIPNTTNAEIHIPHTSHSIYDSQHIVSQERKRINTAVFYKMKQMQDTKIREEEHLTGNSTNQHLSGTTIRNQTLISSLEIL